MNNLWNRSVGPFDEAAVQRHRHMGLLDCNGDVNADAVNFLAHLCAGLFFDALCDSYVEMQTVSRILSYWRCQDGNHSVRNAAQGCRGERHECRTTAEAACLCGCKTNKKKSM